MRRFWNQSIFLGPFSHVNCFECFVEGDQVFSISHRHWISNQSDFCWIIMDRILWLCFVVWMVENVVQIDLWMMVDGRSTGWRVWWNWIVWNVAWKHWWDHLLQSWRRWRNRCVDIHVGQLSGRSTLISHWNLAWLSENSTHRVKILIGLDVWILILRIVVESDLIHLV